jgi:hypothetical protein
MARMSVCSASTSFVAGARRDLARDATNDD